jgi:hypothetical protein
VYPACSSRRPDRNAAAVRLYEGLGFRVWASRESGLYRGIVGGRVRRLAMARPLGPALGPASHPAYPGRP